MNRTTDISIWLDWETLYLDELLDQLTVEERRGLIAALERDDFATHPLTELSAPLAGKTKRFIAFATTDQAPTKTLFRAAATHLRQHELQPRPKGPARQYRPVGGSPHHS